MTFLPRLERVLLTLWVGGVWAIGYLAAPTLFAMLDDRHLAGELAGRMFQIIYMVGLVCGALLLSGIIFEQGMRAMRQWRSLVLAGMWLLVAVSLFVLQPMIADIKAQGEMVAGTEQAIRFGRLHGLASSLYLLTSLGGLALVFLGVREKNGNFSLFRK